MVKAILLCGKVGSGKTTYAKKLMKERAAVLLSVDEIMLSLFGNDAGDMHDYYSERTQKYLYEKAIEILGQGIEVIFDWGFWTKAGREKAKTFFREAGYQAEMHYISVSDDVWRRNLYERNAAFLGGDASVYYMDDDTAELFASRFEMPSAEEYDVYFENKRK